MLGKFGVRYLVHNESTLCYSMPGTMFLNVLHGSVIRGGRDWKNGPFLSCHSDQLRGATKQDFATYRCQPPKGLFA